MANYWTIYLSFFQVLINHGFPFKLGSKVFRLLLDIFLYHNFSTSNFVSTLKVCVIDLIASELVKFTVVLTQNRAHMVLMGLLNANQSQLLLMLLQFCMIEHYYNNPLSYACCQRADTKAIIKMLEPHDVEQFRRVHSFMK